MEMMATSKESGLYSDEELEKIFNDGIKDIKDSLEASRIEDKRYERDVILAWTQGAFKDVAKSYAYDDTELQKMQQYFELMLANPDGMGRDSLLNLFSGVEMNSRDVELLNGSLSVLKDIEKQFGFDFVDEWTKLNEEIGDSVFTLDDFYDALTKSIDGVTVLSVEDILPSAEEFKEQPKLYDEILSEWARVSNYIISISGEFDEAGFNEYWDKFIAEKRMELQQSFPTPSSYGPQLPTGVGKDGKLDISISFDVENANVNNVKTDTVLHGINVWGNPDLTVTNGK